MTSSDPPTVKSVTRAIELLAAIERLGNAGITELTEETGMPKSTVYEHLTTLEGQEYLVKHDDAYQIGLRFLTHGGLARSKLDIFRVGKKEIDSLADETGELATLAIEEHGWGVYLYVSRGENAVNLDTFVGRREHLHPTGIGKAILGQLSRERRDEIVEQRGLPEYTPQTITDRDTLESQLETIRDRGYSIDDQERVENLRCVAAPVQDGDIVGAISVSGPASRFDDHYLEGELAEAVVGAANVISLNINQY